MPYHKKVLKLQIGRDRTRLHRPSARGYVAADRQLKRKKNRPTPLKRLDASKPRSKEKMNSSKGKKSKKSNFERDQFGQIKSCPPSPQFLPLAPSPIRRSNSKPLPDLKVKNSFTHLECSFKYIIL